MHASFPHCYPHGIKYLAARERIWNLASSSALRCITDILSFFFAIAALHPFAINIFFIYTWIREVVEWLHIWIDSHNLPVGCTTNKKLIPQREKALAAVKWLMVFWESSPVSKYPIEGSWKTPSFKEWVFDCLYEASLGYNTHSQLTKLISQTG